MSKGDLNSIIRTLPSIQTRSNVFDFKHASYNIAVERITELLLQYIRVKKNLASETNVDSEIV